MNPMENSRFQKDEKPRGTARRPAASAKPDNLNKLSRAELISGYREYRAGFRMALDLLSDTELAMLKAITQAEASGYGRSLN